MILEGIVTTLNEAGELNIAPMGPRTDETICFLHFRPFQTSQTYRNLKVRPYGVFHVVDDVLLLARAAVGMLDEPPATIPAKRVPGRVLAGACRWFEFEVDSLDDRLERTEIATKIVHTETLRDFFGFNRAKHAVLEAAILATRIHLLPADEIVREFERLRSPVEKTAGPREREAFEFLRLYVEAATSTRNDAG